MKVCTAKLFLIAISPVLLHTDKTRGKCGWWLECGGRTRGRPVNEFHVGVKRFVVKLEM